jgi:hypothetical protein
LQGTRLVLADRRAAAWALDPAEAMLMLPSAIFSPANTGVSCRQHCHQHLSMKCQDDQLYWGNTCEQLMAAFDCESGCGHQVGAEIPCYVTDPSQPTFHQCLVLDQMTSQCDASHKSTNRLCTCV